jgi:hypothetical protein
MVLLYLFYWGNMPNLILYRDIPVDDFLAAYRAHKERPDAVYLPSDAQLRDFALSGVCKVKDQQWPITLFFFNQYDMVQDQTTAFLIVHADHQAASNLEILAKRLRIDLRGQGFPALYRIDPRYGLVYGTMRDAVDPAVRMDRNKCYVTLVLTDDASHPEVSLLDYVDRDYQKRYRQIFEQWNQTPPKKRGFMGFDLSKLRGGLKGESPSPFRYEHIRYFIQALKDRYGFMDLKLSIIYREVTENDLRRTVLDSSAGLFYAVGECRFFNTTEELVA